jgi:NAD+ kinase
MPAEPLKKPLAVPNTIVLVRHGQSEGNVAKKESKGGNHAAFTSEFKNRHNSNFRLTHKGIQQAQTAGTWLRSNGHASFDRYYCSSYLRACETAAYLGLENAEWRVEYRLRERDWGVMDNITEEERRTIFARSLAQRQINHFYWAPEGGESIAQLTERLHSGIVDTLHRECENKRVIVVCHGEVMWALRILFERMSEQRFAELDASKKPFDRIHNCQVLEYSRTNPDDPTEVLGHFGWMRSVCTTDQERSRNNWEKIQRSTLSNNALLELVGRQQRMINN